MKKNIILLGFSLVFLISLSSCDSNVVNYEGGNADIQSDRLILYPESWKVFHPNEWIQEFALDSYSPNLSTDGAVLVYRLNTANAWEPFQSTTISVTDDGILYSEEFWYDYTLRDIAFYTRDTHPTNPVAPNRAIDVKIIIIDKKYLEVINSDGEETPNYEDLLKQLINDNKKIEEIHISSIPK